MNEKFNQFTSQELQSALALLVWKNEQLRDEILKNPKQVIERELNVKFDENLKVKLVNQMESNEVVFILPYNIHNVADQELSDDQLEEVAGGISLSSGLRFIGDLTVRKNGGIGGGAGKSFADTM